MACDITSGRKVLCKDSIGGLKTLYVSTEEMGAITYDITDTDVITAFAGTPEFFQFDLRGATNSLTETITVSEDNGTTLFDQVVACTFPKLTKEMNKQLKLMCYSSPTLVVEDFNGNQRIVGLENQTSASGGTVVSGAAKADLSGYTLTMQGMEKVPANFLDGGITGCGGTISAVQETQA